jgi:TP901 family phage tail tape measure protein
MQVQDNSSAVIKNLGSSLNIAQAAAAKADLAMKNLGVSQANAAIAIDKAVAASNNSALSYDQVALAAAKADQAVARVSVSDVAAAAAAQKAVIADDELAASLSAVAAKSTLASTEMEAANVRNAESMAATGASAEEAGAGIGGMGGIIGGIGPMIALMAIPAVLGLGKASVDTATKYQQSMNMIQSLTGQTGSQMKIIDQGVKQLASDTGVSATQLSGGLYNMLSSFSNVNDAMKMLELSTKDAIIGMTDSTTTATALTKVMDGFGISVKYADQVNGEMMQTVKLGQMSVQDYSNAVAKSSSVAVQYHDTLENMNAAFATMTTSGIKNAVQASTDYNNLLKVLNGNTDAVAKNSKALNPAFNANAFAAMNVADKIDYLNKMVVQHGHNITDVIGKQQNAAAAFTALSTHMDKYRQDLKALNDQQANANALQQQWQITQGGLQVSMNRLQATFQNLMIDLGNAFLPLLTQIMDGVSTLVGNFVAWEEKTHFIENAMTALGNAIGPVWQAIQNLGGALGNVWSAISPIFDNLFGDAQGWGQNLMSGFIDGVESMIGTLTSILNDVATEISNFLGFASPSKKGPGRNLMKWGPAMILSFAQGIQSSSPLVQDAISDITQYFGQLQGGGMQAGGAALGGGAAQSFVSIGSALQTVSLGHPFGAPGASGGSNPTVSALGTTVNALGANTAAVAASTAAKAKTTALTAKQQAAQIKSQQTAQAATANLDATLQKALTASNTSDVQALVDKARSAQDSGNMAMAKFYASQALQLADKDKAAADKAAAKAKKTGGGAGGIGGGLSGLIPKVNQNDVLGKIKPIDLSKLIKVPDVGKAVSDNIKKTANGVQNDFKQLMANPFVQSLRQAFGQAMPGFTELGQAILGLIPVVEHNIGELKNTFQTISVAMAPVIKTAIPVIIKLAGVIADGLGKAIKFLSPYIEQATTAIGKFIGEVATRVAPLLKQWFDDVGKDIDFFQKHWDQIWGKIGPGIKMTWDGIKGTIQIAWAVITGIIKIGLDLLSGNWSQAWTDMKDMVNGIWEGLKTMFGDAIKNLILSFKPLFEMLAKVPGPVGDMAKGVLGQMNTMTDGAIQKTTDMKTKVIDQTIQMHQQTVKELDKMRLDIIQKIQDTSDPVQKKTLDMQLKTVTNMENMHKKAAQAALDMKNDVTKHSQDMADQVVIHSIIPDMVNNIISWFSKLPTEATKWAGDMMNNFINQINNGIGGIGQAVQRVAATIAANLHFSVPDEGPLKDSDKWMPDMMTMLASGMTGNLSQIQQGASMVAGAIGYIHTAAGVALPDYNAGTGQTIADAQPASASSGTLAKELHIHVHLGDSDGDADRHAKRVAQSVKKELAKMARGQAITPRYTSGGTR